MRLILNVFYALALAALVLFPIDARADVVTDWNLRAVQATAVAGRPGPTGVIDIAMVQAAVYDAIQAIELQYEPYNVAIPGASGSPIAAAAKAAHDVLVSRFPAQTVTLNAAYHQYLLDRGIPETDPGVAVGATAAAGIIVLRSGDGSFPVPPPPPFIGGTDPGVWRPTPGAFAPMLAPWLGSVTPFTIRSSSQFRANRPPALNSPEYTRDYNEVKSVGALTGSSRTAAQTDLAHFWNANYVAVLNALLRNLASAHVNSISDSSRLFAMTEMAMADAIIASWDTKSHYVYWRPVTAIQLGGSDGNPKTSQDAGWLPLIASPPYPDYSSGANCITAAATRAMSLFFGTDEVNFSVTTNNTGPTVLDTRSYTRFSDVRDEVVEARIFEGIHFRFADQSARKQGEHVAQWGHAHFFRPITADSDSLGSAK